MNRSKMAAAGLLAAVFAAGLIVGSVAPGALEEQEQQEERPERRPYIEMLQDTLGLAADQRQHIELALDEFYANWRALSRDLREEERRRVQEIRTDVRSKILAALDSSQAALYRDMLAHSDSVRADRTNRRRR